MQRLTDNFEGPAVASHAARHVMGPNNNIVSYEISGIGAPDLTNQVAPKAPSMDIETPNM